MPPTVRHGRLMTLRQYRPASRLPDVFSEMFAVIGDPNWIRTSGLKIRNLALYPAELWDQPEEPLQKVGVEAKCFRCGFRGFLRTGLSDVRDAGRGWRRMLFQ